MKPALFSSLAAMLLLVGCANLQPEYHRPAAPVAAAYPGGPAYSQATAAGGVPAADLGWRNFLVDARLQEIVELALRNNRDLRVAILRMEQARAQYRLQKSARSPQVSVGISGSGQGGRAPTANGGSSAAHAYAADLSASWELDFFGRLANLSDAAREQYVASAYGRQATQLLLVSQVADQYLTLLADDESLAVTQMALETAQASYRIVKLQFDGGVASELDLQQSVTAVDQAQASQAEQTRLRAQAENALVLLVGQALPATGSSATLEQQRILADVPAGMPSDLLRRRPDILQAEAVLRSENADVGAARAAFFPTISLTGTLGAASTALGALFSSGFGAWTFAPALVAPLFNGGANRANLDIATVQKDIGVAQYEKSIQTAFREVSDGLAARGTYDRQLAALQHEAAAQQRRLDLANKLYANGISSYLDVLTAQTALYTARLSVVSARLNRETSLVDLYRALGGGWLERTGDKGGDIPPVR